MSYAYWPLPALFGARRPKSEFDVVDRPVEFADVLKKKEAMARGHALVGTALVHVNSVLLNSKYWKTSEHGWFSIVVPYYDVLQSLLGKPEVTIERLRDTYKTFRIYQSGHDLVFEPRTNGLVAGRNVEQPVPPPPPSAGMSFDAG